MTSHVNYLVMAIDSLQWILFMVKHKHKRDIIRRGGCLFVCSPGRIRQKLVSSHLREDEKPSNSQKPLLFSVDLFHRSSNGFSRYIKFIFYFFDCDFYCDIKKNVKILCFSSFLLNSFQPRIHWQLFLCQLHDKWIFLPEYHKHWTETYSRRKRLWLRLFRNSFVFFVQRGCFPWCQR